VDLYKTTKERLPLLEIALPANKKLPISLNRTTNILNMGHFFIGIPFKQARLYVLCMEISDDVFILYICALVAQ